MTDVLADTSAWISYFRAGGSAELQVALRDALLEGRVQTCWPIRAELLIGARNAADLERLRVLLGSLAELTCGDDLWNGAARLGFDLKRKGLTVPLPDLLIAQAAIDGDVELWHLDDHFEAIREHSTLRTRSFHRAT